MQDKAVRPFGSTTIRLSILIPTLNEARYLPDALAQIRRRAVLGPSHEIIVTDCGSLDPTKRH